MENNIKDILSNARNIAIIGCSKKEHRTSNQIAHYLQEQGYTIFPVHPDYGEVCGEAAYKTVYDIPGDITIDIVDIFRNSDYTAEMVDDIIKRKEMTGRSPVVWTQLGVSSPEAKKKAEEVGLPYVEEKCIMVEHRNHFN